MSARGRMRCLAACAAGGLSFTLAACSPETGDDRLSVAVTVAPLAGLVDRVAGDVADVTVMIPAGASPVTYEPSFSQVRAAAGADVYVSVGHPAFAWEITWLNGLLERGEAIVVSGADGCDVLPDDPHVWLSLPCARSMAEGIALAVQQARPEAAEVVAASLEDLLTEMARLGAEADSLLGSHRGGSFIVLHPAWGYLARDYDLRQMAILEHGSGDAGPAELAAIVEEARKAGLVNVVVQPQFSAEAARLVADELGGETVPVDPLVRNWLLGFSRAIQVLAEQVKP